VSAAASEAARLRGEGLTYEEISRRLGVSTTTVWRYCNPERQRVKEAGRNAYKRKWENAMRASCSSCGGPMAAGSIRADGSRGARTNGDLCAGCISRRRVDLVLEMWRLREAEGLTNVGIGERLDVPPQTVATELSRLRALGFSVPLAPYRGADKRPSRACKLDKQCAPLAAALRERGITPEATPALIGATS
jgi:AcrR family transcriptional regulator